jgi:hypothetical protein
MGLQPTGGNENRHPCRPREKLALSSPKGGGPGRWIPALRQAQGKLCAGMTRMG